MEFPAHNPQTVEMVTQARRFARREYPVLIQGESGTGKEYLARYIHSESARTGRFVRLECATVPTGRWEAELEQKLAEAEGGTLFLAEVGELDWQAQTSLLHLLETPRVNPDAQGGSGRVPVRLIASTTPDLQEHIREELFRETLFYQLGVIRLRLLPLRERKEDLEPLTNYILTELNGGELPALSAEAISAILLYDWPGNVRELKNALTQALASASGDSAGAIELRHLPEVVAKVLRSEPNLPLFKRYTRSAEFLLIRWALSICGGDRTQTAHFLGLSRAALYKKLKLYPELQSHDPAVAEEPGAYAEGDDEEPEDEV